MNQNEQVYMVYFAALLASPFHQAMTPDTRAEKCSKEAQAALREHRKVYPEDTYEHLKNKPLATEPSAHQTGI